MTNLIVHLFPKSQFAEGFIDFINNYFEADDHRIVLYTNKPFLLPDRLYSFKNVYDYDQHSFLWLYQLMKKTDKIIFHNLAVNIYELFGFCICTSLVRKSIWLVWGGDLYCYREPKLHMMDRFVEAMRKRIIKQIPIIATLTDGDYELAKKWYKTSAKGIRLNYYEEKNNHILYELKNKKHIENGTHKNIIVGNSATKTNRHIEALKLLQGYANEDISIYVPLAYGDNLYAEEIIAFGTSAFGEKFIPIREYMSLENYFSLLSTMDIALFNNDRQQAIGNIMALAFLSKKLYLREHTSMWDEWVNKKGFAFEPISNITSDFKTFCAVDKEKCNKNEKLASNLYSLEERKEEWKKAFELSIR